ncbi:hypothetical protein BD414DRAFT_473271 [Trametes punicea]|nr:hypothetical protein BD414DRAFT_473271 [Trametes punicea]
MAPRAIACDLKRLQIHRPAAASRHMHCVVFPSTSPVQSLRACVFASPRTMTSPLDRADLGGAEKPLWHAKRVRSLAQSHDELRRRRPRVFW